MIRLRNFAKRTLGITISALLTVSMMPVQAYALDELDIEVTVDQITVNGDPAASPIDRSEEDFSSVSIENGDGWDDVPGGQVEVSVRNVVDEDDGAAIYIYNEYGENINTNIQSGDITSSTAGIAIRSSVGSVTAAVGNIDAGEYGAYIWTDGGNATLTAGSIQAEGVGAYIGAEDGNATLKAGSVQAQGIGILANVDGGGETNVVVSNGISAGNDWLDGEIYWGPEAGVAIDNYCGKANVDVTGDVSGGIGIAINGCGKSESAVTVNGDVTGIGTVGDIEFPGIGISYNAFTEDEEAESEAEVLVTGTVAGDAENGVGVFTVDDGSNFKLTAWKIEQTTEDSPVGPGVVAAKRSLNEDLEVPLVENEEFEKSIQYIIKIDPSEVAGVSSLGATKEDGSALDKEGDYEWALEDEKLLLKVELQDGYELTNAYGKENQSYPFTKDASGNYYITVPRGGGVFISVETALKPVDPDEPVDPDQPVDPDEPVDPDQPVSPVVNVEVVDDESSNDNPPTVQGAVANADTLDPVIFNSSIIRMVMEAAPGANVTVAAAGNMMISKEVVDTLIVRSDVSLTITYVIDGVMYSVTIPAGANLNLYRNAAGGIDIFTLVQLFGAIVIG
jgi:hypothetical protein